MNKNKVMKRIIFLLLVLFIPTISGFAQSIGAHFEVDNIKYKITKAKLDVTPKEFEVAVVKVGGSGIVTIPSTVIDDKYHETFKVTSTNGWMEPSPTAVTEIILSEGITKISDGGFCGSKGLTKITIPKSCTFIGASCFNNNPNFTRFEVNAANTNYSHDTNGWLFNKSGNELIYYPSGIGGEVNNIPSTITKIGRDAFRLCKKITKIKIPTTVTEIVYDAEGHPFYNSSATYIDVNDANIKYKDYDGVLCDISGKELIAFPPQYIPTAGIPQDPEQRIYTIPNSVETVLPNAFYNASNYPLYLDLNNVKTIMTKAFSTMGNLKKVIIGQYVELIDAGAFGGCNNLTKFEVSDLNANYKAKEGVIFTKNEKTLVLYPSGKIGNYKVPTGTETIFKEAFSGTRATDVVTIANTVITIGEGAFSGSSWRQVVFEEPSKVKNIGTRAFVDSRIVGTFTIPASVEEMGDGIFKKANGITEIHFDDNSKLTKIPTLFATEMDNLEKVVFDGSAPNLTTFEVKAFAYNPKLKFCDIPSNLTEIKHSAFLETPNLETVIFRTPSSISTIGESAFTKSGIKHIELPESVTKISGVAFDQCANLEKIFIPKNVNEIIYTAFNLCENLKEINVDKENTKYTSLDGMLCTKDKKTLVTFPAGKADSKYTLIPYFKKVGPYAFYGSNKITNITFPRSVEEIGSRAIALCKKLKSLSFMGEDKVPVLTSEIMYESSNPSSINIYVRKRWYNNPANLATIKGYDNVFKDVIPSFISAEGYDRGVEFFQTSDENVGVISFDGNEERTSVIVMPEATQPAFVSHSNNQIAQKTYTVSSVLDFAFEEKNLPYSPKVRAITLLADINGIGLNAFKRSSIEEIYFVGNTPGNLNYKAYEQMGSYPFKENQKIYVKKSKQNDYKTAWEKDQHTLAIEWQIPQSTNSHGGTVCYPFDVVYPQNLGDNDIKPYVPVDFTHIYDTKDPFVRAYSLDNYYVPAFVGALIRSKNTKAVNSYCQMDEDQAHNKDGLNAVNYQENAENRMIGAVEEIIIANESGFQYYTFSKKRGCFVHLKNDAKFPYFKAYLRLKENTATPGKGFSILFDDEGTITGIDGITELKDTDDTYYDLNGIKVEKPKKGVYIRNGKKVIIK